MQTESETRPSQPPKQHGTIKVTPSLYITHIDDDTHTSTTLEYTEGGIVVRLAFVHKCSHKGASASAMGIELRNEEYAEVYRQNVLLAPNVRTVTLSNVNLAVLDAAGWAVEAASDSDSIPMSPTLVSKWL